MTDRKSFLFTIWEGGGNIPPVIETARKLAAVGHRIRFLGDSCNRAEVEACGATFVPWSRAPNRKDRSPESQTVQDWAAATPQEGLLAIIRDFWCGPALAYAQEMQERAASLGYDWPSVDGVLEKVAEEATELVEAADDRHRREEFGDLLMVLVNLGRKLGIDTEAALRAASAKFASATLRGVCGIGVATAMIAVVAEAPAGDPLEQFRSVGIAIVQFAVDNPEYYRVLSLPGIDEMATP
jgi:NTP pyrophosphatase (non-canonical NTP hydrolase)